MDTYTSCNGKNKTTDIYIHYMARYKKMVVLVCWRDRDKEGYSQKSFFFLLNKKASLLLINLAPFFDDGSFIQAHIHTYIQLIWNTYKCDIFCCFPDRDAYMSKYMDTHIIHTYKVTFCLPAQNRHPKTVKMNKIYQTQLVQFDFA